MLPMAPICFIKKKKEAGHRILKTLKVPKPYYLKTGAPMMHKGKQNVMSSLMFLQLAPVSAAAGLSLPFHTALSNFHQGFLKYFLFRWLLALFSQVSEE